MQNDGWAHSSHIAMSLLLALFPFSIFSLSLAGQLSAQIDLEDLTEFILGAWPDAFSEPIEREILAVLDASDTTKLTVSALLSVFFASNGVDAIRSAVTGAYRESDPRPVWKTRLLCIVFVLVGSLVLIAAGVLTIVLPAYFEFLGDTAPDLYAVVFAIEPLRVTIAVALLILLLFACHLWLPGLKRRLSQVLPGVAVTLVLWAVCAQGFAFYIANFGSYSATYAGLAGILGALVFMYMMAAIFIIGAEFNAQLEEELQG